MIKDRKEVDDMKNPDCKLFHQSLVFDPNDYKLLEKCPNFPNMHRIDEEKVLSTRNCILKKCSLISKKGLLFLCKCKDNK